MADTPSAARRAYNLQLVDVETGVAVPLGRFEVHVPVTPGSSTTTPAQFDIDLVAGLRQAADQLEARAR